MAKPTFQDITGAELRWINGQLSTGRIFVGQYAPEFRDFGLAALDTAWAAWMAKSPSDVDDINHAINSVGIPFGSLLVASGEFTLCIASDDWGTDLAIRALPDHGDVLIYPADFVSKRWESRTTDFLVDCFAEIMEHVSRTREEWRLTKSKI